MTFQETWSRVDAVQKGTLFKVIASIVLLALAAAGAITYVVVTSRPADPNALVMPELAPDASAEEKNAVEATRRIAESVLAGREDPTKVVVGAAVTVALGLAVIWLGLGITYLLLILLGLVPALLLGLGTRFTSFAWLLGGVVVLAASFSALMRGLRVLFGGSSSMMAVARNVLDEATRLKISQVFIVVLIVGLAILPLTLGGNSQLRYTVQTFLSFAMGGSFWTIATLVVLFSVATVSFEQRDRVIWQTMTKPIAPWQYILGKWLGVSGLAAILLAVAGSGVFLFTEHLRSKPAYGESAENAYTVEGGGLSKDRHILETQILSARRIKLPEPLILNEDALDKAVEQIANNERLDDAPEQAATEDKAFYEQDREERYKILKRQLSQAYQQQYRSLEPLQGEQFRFVGLGAARDGNHLLLLRYKVDTGNNAPNEQYKVTFQFQGGELVVKDVILGQFQIIELLPTALDKDGNLTVLIVNGDALRGIPNERSISFPPDGLEISFAASTFAANFARVMFVLWVKLAFLAMLGVCAATFLSFPVACLVAFGAFLAAEAAPFLRASLDSFATESVDGKEIYYVRTLISYVSMAVSWLFSTYGELKPTRRVVEGLLMSWREVGSGLVILAAWTGLLYAAAVNIFRRRELATYSGH